MKAGGYASGKYRRQWGDGRGVVCRREVMKEGWHGEVIGAVIGRGGDSVNLQRQNCCLNGLLNLPEAVEPSHCPVCTILWCFDGHCDCRFCISADTGLPYSSQSMVSVKMFPEKISMYVRRLNKEDMPPLAHMTSSSTHGISNPLQT